MKAKSAKAKGSRLEKWWVTEMRGLGLSARKQPMSGALPDFPHDGFIEIPCVGPAIVECKARKSGIKTIQGWMKDKAEWLVIKPDFQDPYHVVTHPLMLKLLSALEAQRQELEELRAAKEGADDA